MKAPGFCRVVGDLQGEALQRVPRGFARDHPAADYLRMRQFLAGCEYPAALECFRRALRLNPSLEGVRANIAHLERAVEKSESD